MGRKRTGIGKRKGIVRLEAGGGRTATPRRMAGQTEPCLTAAWWGGASGCVDKVGANNSATILNHSDGICDTYGSFTLTAASAGAAAATNVTLFRTDAAGLNLAASGGHFS